MLEPRFRAVYSQHVDHVWRNLRHLGVPGAEIDDAVQETFLVAFRRFGDVREGAPFRPWLSGIARRVASHHRRARGRRLRLVETVGREPRVGSDPHDEVALRDAARLVEHFVETLPARRREVFVLAEIEGYTGAEIAEALEINVNTVFSRLRSARASFERYLATLRARERGEVLLAEVRKRRMPAASKRKAWAAIGAQLGAKTSALLPAFKAVAISVALGTTGLTSIAVAARATQPDPAPVRLASAVAPRSIDVPPDPPKVAPTPVVDSTPAPPVEAPEPKPAKKRKIDPLQAEVELLRRMRAAARSGDYDRALRLVKRHRKRFRKGELAVERDVQEIAALCGLGRMKEARARIVEHGQPLPPAVSEICRTKRKPPGQPS